jgi:hypothetical protein
LPSFGSTFFYIFLYDVYEQLMSNGDQMAFLVFSELKCKYAAQILLLLAHIVLSN